MARNWRVGDVLEYRPDGHNPRNAWLKEQVVEKRYGRWVLATEQVTAPFLFNRQKMVSLARGTKGIIVQYDPLVLLILSERLHIQAGTWSERRWRRVKHAD